MLHDARAYLYLVGLQIRSQLQYRASFLIDWGGALLTTFAHFAGLALVFQQIPSINGWTLGQVAFLFGMVEFSFGLADMVFTGFDPGFFGRQIRLGTLDQMLLRPVNITMQVLGSAFFMRRIGRMINGLLILSIALTLEPIQWTLPKLLLLPAIPLGMVLFFGGLFIIGATFTIWTIEGIELLNIVTYGTSDVISFPMTIYPSWLRNIFTFVIPAIFLNYAPAVYLFDLTDPLGLPTWSAILGPMVGVGTLGISLLIWQFGLRHYQSTGT